MNPTNKDAIRANIARTLSDVIPAATSSLIETAAATGLTTRCIAHTQIHGIIDFADLISLCRALKFDPAKLIPEDPDADGSEHAEAADDAWHDPRTQLPDADIAVIVITLDPEFGSIDSFPAHWTGLQWLDESGGGHAPAEVAVWRHLTQTEADDLEQHPELGNKPIVAANPEQEQVADQYPA